MTIKTPLPPRPNVWALTAGLVALGWWTYGIFQEGYESWQDAVFAGLLSVAQVGAVVLAALLVRLLIYSLRPHRN
jgi:hypothetical protein